MTVQIPDGLPSTKIPPVVRRDYRSAYSSTEGPVSTSIAINRVIDHLGLVTLQADLYFTSLVP